MAIPLRSRHLAIGGTHMQAPTFRERLELLAVEYEKLQVHAESLEAKVKTHTLREGSQRSGTIGSGKIEQLQADGGGNLLDPMNGHNSPPSARSPKLIFIQEGGHDRWERASQASQAKGSEHTGTGEDHPPEQPTSERERHIHHRKILVKGAESKSAFTITESEVSRLRKMRAGRTVSLSNGGGGKFEHEEVRELWKILSPSKRGTIAYNEISDILLLYVSEEDSFSFQMEEVMQAFVNDVNLKLSGEAGDHMDKECLRVIMAEDDLPAKFGEALAGKVELFREAMFALRMNHLVLTKNNLDHELIGQFNGRAHKKFQQWLDLAVVMVILLNAVVIGLSYDVKDTDLWNWCEVVFAGFFVCELAVKLSMNGFEEHFLGVDWSWNGFDAVLVAFAVFDATRSLIEIFSAEGFDDSSWSKLTILRTIRLARLSRMVRLMRWKPLRELRLMVVGLMNGVKTIMWAIVLLMVICYVLALLLRELHLEGAEDTSCSAEMEAAGSCTRTQEYQDLMKDVPVAMFTVYRCFIGDCADQGGRPLAVHMSDEYGFLFKVGYVISTMLVTLGLFNLIMAIFVENTLALAKLDEKRRKDNVAYEKMRVAKMMHKLVSRIIQRASESKRQTTLDMINSVGLRGHWRRLRDWAMGERDNNEDSSASVPASTARVDVSREVFEVVVMEPDMQSILEDLEVGVEDTGKVFDTLDVNGDGNLQLHELVNGIMQLRGPADKLDMMRTMQTVQTMKVTLQQIHHHLHRQFPASTKSLPPSTSFAT